jgi:twitching motility protein PilT
MGGYDDELSRLVDQLNRSTPGKTPEKTVAAAARVQDFSSLDQFLSYAARQNASDLLLIADTPVTLRVNGALTPAAGPLLSADDVRGLLLPLLEGRRQDELERNKSVDFCFVRESIGRFRANLHYQRGTLAGSIRILPARVPTIESLHLPPVLARIAERRQGLALVTGPTGCGKSSTLAALIDAINTRRRDHIVTIEDPIEYQHSNRNSIVEQIEVGHDTPDFAHSLRSILRQTPDVILVGEMRDAETMATALSAAETGHLVLSTLHTNDAAQAVFRILDSFPNAQQSQIRQQLSLALIAVVAQQLVPAADGLSRYPALEIMWNTDAIRNLIRKGDDHMLRSQISMGRSEGMVTMEQSLADLARSGRITRDIAYAHCFRTDDLRRYLEG